MSNEKSPDDDLCLNPDNSSSSGVEPPSPTPGAGAPNKNPKRDSNFSPNGDERILYVDSLPTDMDFSQFMEKFGVHGDIKVIKLSETNDFASWRLWIEFTDHKAALKAFNCSVEESLKCDLIHRVPRNIDVDVFYPNKVSQETSVVKNVERKPLPAKWLIVTTHTEFYNLFHFRKHLRDLVGTIVNSDVRRFGRNSFLVHAKSLRQGHMIAKLKSNDVIKEVKPHYSFSYAKGVVFSHDLYDLSDEELFEMCEDKVWKIFKVPNSSMIIFTFNNEVLPDFILIDRERFRVKPYKQRPLQCFKCYGYGHSSKFCKKDQVCGTCSLAYHGNECTKSELCINCKGNHHSRNKACITYKIEMEAIEKAHVEHLSIGQAKRLMYQGPQYSEMVKNAKANKDHPRNPNSKPKPQLSPSQLEVHPASPPSSKGATMPLPREPTPGWWKAPQASGEEASQAVSLPDLGVSQDNTLIRAPHTAQVHVDEPIREKRPRTPSPSKPSSHSNSGNASKRGNNRSVEDLSASSGKPRPNLSRPVHTKSDKPNKKSSGKK